MVAAMELTPRPLSTAAPTRRAANAAALAVPPAPPEPWAPAELRALVHAGENDSDACERLLAQAARVQGALEVAVGDGLAALCLGDRLASLGFSCLGDYAREALGIGERKAQAMAQLARDLRSRPVLRQAVVAGEVRVRAAQTVVPVATGDAEPGWVGRARRETVRALERAVREARGGAADPEEWVRLRVALSPSDRAIVDEALEIAGRLLPASRRPQRLEAMAQEYLGAFPVEAGDDGAGRAGAAFRADDARARREHREARLEEETEGWSFLERPAGVSAPEVLWDELGGADEIDAELRGLAAKRDAWDALLGYCAYAVRRSGLWRVAGFDSFEHHCKERLGLAARTVEQRAALEKRLWQSAALREARDRGLSYEKLRQLARLPDAEIAGWVPRARTLTCIALRDAVDERDEAQMRAARKLRAGVPERVAELLAAAFRAVRAVEGCLLPDGACLVRVAGHFVETWRPHVKRSATRGQRIRARDRGRCQVPGCSRAAVHAHHVDARAHGGGDHEANLVGLCAFHHLRAIHGGYMRVRGAAPDALVWTVRGRPFRAGAEVAEEGGLLTQVA